jgi:hypothetical protein
MTGGKDSKIAGGLGSISLHDLIQLLGMNRRTTTLVLDRQGRQGRIYFDKGNVVHAFTGDLEGPDAFGELLQWQDAHFVIEEGIPSLPRVTITESAVGLMLSSMTRLDEGTRDTPAAGAATAPPGHQAPPAKPPTSGRFSPRARKAVRGAVISPPRRSGTRRPVLPIVGVALLLAAGGATWWALGGRSEESVAADEAATPPPTPAPTLPPTEPPEPNPAAEAGESAAPETEPTPTAAGATPTPVPDGALAVTAPAGVELRIDGRRAQSGTLRVSPGRHTIEVIRPEVLGAQRETVEIEPGQTLRLSFTADEFGWLQVVVIPWAEVFVGDEAIGQTPMGKIKAAVGRHTVVLRHPELGERQQTVTVRPGETALVRVNLQGASG